MAHTKRPSDMKQRRRWEVTVSSICRATGRSPRRIRDDINDGLVKPWDTLSLAHYVMGHVHLKDAKRL